jgi:uncharacterized protein YabN with tetrapyrrole methylase and pyrophosphatase domain
MRAARVGFDWPDVAGVRAKLAEEIAELESAPTPEEVAHELGDLLFTVVNLSRRLDVDAESALREANGRFKRRFGHIEQEAARLGKPLGDMSLAEMDKLWEEAKGQDAE